MAVKGLDQFRQLIQEHKTDESNQLTALEIQGALQGLTPAEKLKARDLALEAMLETSLSGDALKSLQSFLGVKHGHCPTEKSACTPGTQTFALRLFEAQGINSVGRSQVWKWEAEQVLKTLDYGASKEEVNSAVRTLLSTAELTQDALASARLYINENRMLSKETLKWPSDDRPTDFTELTDRLSETLENAYKVEALPVAGDVMAPMSDGNTVTSSDVDPSTFLPPTTPATNTSTVTPSTDVSSVMPPADTSTVAPAETQVVPNNNLAWTGPPTPEFAIKAGDTTFDARIKAENLVNTEKMMMRPPLQSVMSIGVQLGMEQGRRAVMSSPEVKSAGEQIDAAEQALANGQVSQARHNLVNFIHALQSPSMQSPLSSLVRADGTIDWPEGDLPVVREELEAPLRQLLEDAYRMERINPDENISWTGPRSPQFLNALPYEVRLSAENLRQKAVAEGRDPLDELVSLVLDMGMEQGRRMSVYQDFTPALQTAHTALTAINQGYVDNAKFMLPMIKQVWTA